MTDSAGRSKSRLTRQDATDRFPLWSPDGTPIAFGSQVDRAGSSGHGFEWDRGDTSIRSGQVSSGWSRDGKRIAFAAVADGIDVYTVDVVAGDALTSSLVRT